ncbi:hypothetical protein F0P96_17405 [Hymenobacter busanensis]|uniref:Uncharacterized protein n=1 Tax=Hymenobacter busanensis TaxID=2607656 RepID=A0A7L5A127_9BACT|nr:hypothetical protein [Hymenobacter busanensis]KAA9327023.1 hypothetical protein F0P96_17405 [Hymenobacter busanensis]QHJ09474.1 hypothetical protein GUY19_20220 [Hymenobacter busanensis]
MSAIQTHPLDCSKHRILSLDANEHGQFVALLNHGEVWSNDWRLPLRQSFRFPLIRRVDADSFLVVECRRTLRNNGFLFSTAGELLHIFDAGDAVEDVMIQAGRIVVSHFDEEPGDGLAVFDLTGRQLFGFNSRQQEFIFDCYAMCPSGAESVLFYAYTEFHLHELRLTDFQLRQWPTPPDFLGSHALTASHDNVIFWGSYADNTGLFWWNRHNRVTSFGNVPCVLEARPRGLGNGKFLTHDDRGFTIIDAMELMRMDALQQWRG